MGVNSLPNTVSRQRRGCDLNPGPSASESSTLTTRLPSHLGCEQSNQAYRGAKFVGCGSSRCCGSNAESGSGIVCVARGSSTQYSRRVGTLRAGIVSVGDGTACTADNRDAQRLLMVSTARQHYQPVRRNWLANRRIRNRNVCRILVRGSMPPCRLRRRKFWKFDYEMVRK